LSDGVDWGEAFTYAVAVDSRRERPVCSIPGFIRWQECAGLPLGSRGKSVKWGGALATIEDSTEVSIYAFKGNNTLEFYKYDPATGNWTTKESIPAVGSIGKMKRVKYGAALASANGKVYAVKGNNSLEFWEYDPCRSEGYKWQQLPDAPAGSKRIKKGGSLAAACASDTAYIYLLKGNKTREFARCNTLTGLWQSPPRRRAQDTTQVPA
jgi:hypothetical protein